MSIKISIMLAVAFVCVIIFVIEEIKKHQKHKRLILMIREANEKKEPEKNSFKAFCDDPGKTLFIPENSFIIRKVKEITFKDYEELNEMLNSSNPEDDLILNILRLDETESGKKAVLLVTTCGKIGDLRK